MTLESFSRQGKPLRYWPREVAALTHTDGWQTVSQVIPVAAEAGSLRVVAFMGAKQGTMAIRSLSLTPMVETTMSLWLGRALLLAWLLAAFLCLRPLLRRRMLTPVRALALLGAAALLAGAMAPHPHLGYVTGTLKQFAYGGVAAARTMLAQIKTEQTSRTQTTRSKASASASADGGQAASKGALDVKSRSGHVPNTRRQKISETGSGQQAGNGTKQARPIARRGAAAEHVGHMVAYLGISALMLVAYGRRRLPQVLAGLCLLAITSEALQSFLITREAEWSDLAYNGAGILLGTLTAVVYWALEPRLMRRLRLT